MNIDEYKHFIFAMVEKINDIKKIKLIYLLVRKHYLK